MQFVCYGEWNRNWRCERCIRVDKIFAFLVVAIACPSVNINGKFNFNMNCSSEYRGKRISNCSKVCGQIGNWMMFILVSWWSFFFMFVIDAIVHWTPPKFTPPRINNEGFFPPFRPIAILFTWHRWQQRPHSSHSFDTSAFSLF